MGLLTAFYTFSCGTFRIQQEGDRIVSIQMGQKPTCVPSTSSWLMDTLAEQMDEYFRGRRQNFDVPYDLRGTSFQKRVWSALCQIPYGQTRSYLDIAKSIGNARACRAVGMANHRNSLLILIPCHRVIGADGSLGGYAAGTEIKQFLLDLEQKHKS